MPTPPTFAQAFPAYLADARAENCRYDYLAAGPDHRKSVRRSYDAQVKVGACWRAAVTAQIAAIKVVYFGRVARINRAMREDLFPGQPPNPKSGREYYQLHLRSLERLPNPITSARPRRNPFIPTTWRKFSEAGQINDLFDESPLEDRLWQEFKARRIPAERQWEVEAGDRRYYLDFALLCNEGNVDVETDGDTWHKNRTRQDNERNNAVASAGWHVLRFNTQQIREAAGTYCISQVETTINTLGGLQEETLTPRLFYELPEGHAQQLALFDSCPSYDLD
jgi:very-short-patch-repair endonuclease